MVTRPSRATLSVRGLLTNLQCVLGIQKPEKLHGLGHQPRPTGLVTGAQPDTVVAVEVFVEEDVIPPVAIALELFGTTIDGPSTVLVAGEDPAEPG